MISSMMPFTVLFGKSRTKKKADKIAYLAQRRAQKQKKDSIAFDRLEWLNRYQGCSATDFKGLKAYVFKKFKDFPDLFSQATQLMGNGQKTDKQSTYKTDFFRLTERQNELIYGTPVNSVNTCLPWLG
jgi:hypothetical protein